MATTHCLSQLIDSLCRSASWLMGPASLRAPRACPSHRLSMRAREGERLWRHGAWLLNWCWRAHYGWGWDGRAPVVKCSKKITLIPPSGGATKSASTHSRTRRTHRRMREGLRSDHHLRRPRAKRSKLIGPALVVGYDPLLLAAHCLPLPIRVLGSASLRAPRASPTATARRCVRERGSGCGDTEHGC